MKTLALLLALICGPAAASLPSCWPDTWGGAGSALRSGAVVGVGRWVAWDCMEGTLKRTHIIGFRAGAVLKHPDVPGIQLPQVASEYWAANVADGWPEELLPLLAAATGSLPPPAVWNVAPNGAYPDRPAYPVVAGARKTTSTGRVPVLLDGKPNLCDCSAPTVEGSSTYCPTATSGGLVVLCRKAA